MCPWHLLVVSRQGRLGAHVRLDGPQHHMVELQHHMVGDDGATQDHMGSIAPHSVCTKVHAWASRHRCISRFRVRYVRADSWMVVSRGRSAGQIFVSLVVWEHCVRARTARGFYVVGPHYGMLLLLLRHNT